MTSTFYLKQPNSDKDSLILFSCHFKYEGKKFVYSTGEKISPKNWDFKNKQPNQKGKYKAKESASIELQLGRYKDCFKTIQATCLITKEEFTSKILKTTFDEEFKKAPSVKNLFYNAFDEFVAYKTKNIDWSPSTIKRYSNIKNILQEFEGSRNYKITFNSIN
ncbi:MAG: integrase, partial [Flavobacteriaceae bacterium]|nr:integrase [Flavobacteriaceae bacterium]